MFQIDLLESNHPTIADPEQFTKVWRTVGPLIAQLKRIGWSGIGFKRHEMDILAAHHFNVSIAGLLFGLMLREREIPFNLLEHLVTDCIHDLSEFGGGDIGVPRAMEYPELKAASRKLEEINRRVLCEAMGEFAGNKYEAQAQKEMQQKDDEDKMTKLLDRLEALLYLHRVRLNQPFTDIDEAYYKTAVYPIVDSIVSPKLKQIASELVEAFIAEHKEGFLGCIIKPITHETSCRRFVRVVNELQQSKETTRTGFIMAGLHEKEVNTIAEHGHVVAIGLILLAWNLEQANIPFDLQLALEIALVQETGKLYGADQSAISGLYRQESQQATHLIRKTTVDILGKTLGTSLNNLHDPALAASSEGGPGPEIELQLLHQQALTRASDVSKVVLIMSRLADHMHYDLAVRPESYSTDHKKYVDEQILASIDTLKSEQLRTYLKSFLQGVRETVEAKKLRGPIAHILFPSQAH